MRKTILVLGLTATFLVLLDAMVASTLSWAERNGKLGALVQYFDYGRSVPGKLAQWEDAPKMPGNLYDVAWRSEIVEQSQEAFLEEEGSPGPILRSYGMSFVNNIIRHAVEINPNIKWDAHAGPGAPPNFTFALFQDDRNSRRSGDIVVLGILSSSVTGMAALSNRTWVFEQPAPFTYPIFWPEGPALRRVEPIIDSVETQRSLTDSTRHSWADQLREEDYFFNPRAFGLTWLDKSPFARLVRRSLATSSIERTKTSILAGAYPYPEVLQRMVHDFALTAREDGQTPVVMLIQSRNPTDPNVLKIVQPVLDKDDILYFATVEHVDPTDASSFLSDGHYTPKIDRLFAENFITLIGSN